MTRLFRTRVVRRRPGPLLTFFVGLLMAGSGAYCAAQSAFLPLEVGAKWVLRNRAHKDPIVFEVTQKEGNAYHIVSTYPWGSSEWVLEPSGDSYVMTRFGMGGQTMPLNDRPVFVDFGRGPRSKWSNSLGTLQIESTTISVQGVGKSYSDCVLLRHQPKSGSQVFVFAKGIGFVQYAEGRNAFVLDEPASKLPQAREARSSRGISGRTAPAEAPARWGRSRGRRETAAVPRPGASVPIGLTFNSLANESKTPQNILRRFEQTVDAGANMLSGGASWRELEPSRGQYSLGDLSYLASVSKSKKMPVAYTLKVIETVHKAVPPDLSKRSWNSNEMRSRVAALIDRVGETLRQGDFRWFNFGYEIDGYLSQHSREVGEFVELYKFAAARMREVAPGVQVSSTIAFMDLNSLSGRLSKLNPELDFIAVTYSPIQPGWTVGPPESIHDDVQRLKDVAGGRKIFLQEIAYPTSALNNGSQEKQAEFFRLAFDEIEKDSGRFVAANFMMLGDLSDVDTERFGKFYGLPNDKRFKAMMQTLGMFDTEGRPKASWGVFKARAKR